MFENIPKNWEKDKLKNILDILRNGANIKQFDNADGIPISRIETIANGYVDFNKVGYANIYDDKYKDYYIQKGDILLSHINSVAHLGKCAFCNFDSKLIHGMNLLLLRANQNILPKFLYYLLNSQILKKQLPSITKKSVNQASMSTTNLGNLNVIYPINKNEQQEIVDVLDAASEIIRLRTACIESAQALIPALFQEMFDISKYPLLKLDEICEVKGGKRLPKGYSLQEEKTEHPYIRVTNFKNNNIDIKDLKYISNDVFEQIKRYTISCNDIYMSIAGTIGLVGEIPNELDNANLTENAAKLILKNNSFNKKFLIHCLSSGFLQKQISEATVGVGVPKLALIRILNLKLPNVPTEQQELFAEKVQEIESYIKTQQAELENAKTMFQSLLHHSFTGELTRHKFGGDANG